MKKIFLKVIGLMMTIMTICFGVFNAPWHMEGSWITLDITIFAFILFGIFVMSLINDLERMEDK